MRLWSRPISFLVLAPSVVMVLGFGAAVLFGWLGVNELRRRSDAHAMQAAEILGLTLTERLRAVSTDQRSLVLERAARRAGVELLLADPSGNVVVDATLRTPSRSTILDLLCTASGTTHTQLGRVRYSVHPVQSGREPTSLIVFKPAQDPPPAMGPLLTSLAVLVTLLVGVAALVASALARDVNADVDFVRRRIRAMAKQESEPAGKPVPIRSVDAVGELTCAFNELVGRYAEAERGYRENLARALTYDRDRSAFLAALSHELRTPLNAILGFAEVLLAEVDGPLSDTARESLEVIRTSGRHLASLIDDILDLSALESGQLRLARSYVDIYDIAQSVVREEQVSAQLKGIELRLSGVHAAAWADPRRGRQIITNVVGNGIKFTQSGYVEVQVARDGSTRTTVAVTDTGPGIAPDEQATIFEEYTQSGDLRVRRGGTGLGLAITRRLVQMHGGSIALESRLSRGSTFTIVLPSESESDKDLDMTPLEAVTTAAGSVA